MTSKPFALPIRFLTSLLLSLSLLHWGCEEIIDTSTAKPELDVQQLVNEQAELNSFAAALERVAADTLKNTKLRFTIFAPTDQAFTTFLQNSGYASLDQVPDAELKSIVRYHIALGQRTFTSSDSLALLTSRDNRKIFILKEQDNFTVNNEARLVSPNLMANNGVVHKIDKVLKVPAQNLGSYILGRNENEFNLLRAALERTNLLSYLSTPRNSTLFAPTDAAFQATADWATVEAIENADPAPLKSILLYHILPAYRFIGMFDQDTVYTRAGKKVALNASNKTVKGLGNDAVTPLLEAERDVLTGNGILHAIDALLLPDPLEEGIEGGDAGAGEPGDE